jgi:chromate transporter
VISPARLFVSFLRLGSTAFGGPAMIAHIREMAVDRNRWVGPDVFRRGVALCQSIPGATAMQMAGYVGLRAGGLRGAAASFVGFGLPAFLLMTALAAGYAGSKELPVVVSLFSGLQVLVVAIVAHATFVFGREIANRARDLFLAAASAALFGIGVSPFLVIAAAAVAGMAFLKDAAQAAPRAGPTPARPGAPPRPLLVFFVLACAALAALYAADRTLYRLATVMLRVDLFAFGGGFAALPLMFHEIVNGMKWMDGRTFMDGIALGQVTPGPIVITATFVGYLVAGLGGALAATAGIFTPSFLVLVVVAPWHERWKESTRFAAASRGILSSFVGLLLYMTIRFGAAVPWTPWKALLGSAAVLALARKVNIVYVVLAGAALSVLLFR